MFQQVTLIGNVGKDPEVVTFNNGNSITKFSLATSRSWKDEGGQKQTKTTWHNIVVRGGQQGYVNNYVKAGSKLHVIGEIEIDQKKDDMGKVTATYHSVSAQRILGLDGRDSSNAGDSTQMVQQPAQMVQQPAQMVQQVPMQAAPMPQQQVPMQAAPQPQYAPAVAQPQYAPAGPPPPGYVPQAAPATDQIPF